MAGDSDNLNAWSTTGWQYYSMFPAASGDHPDYSFEVAPPHCLYDDAHFIRWYCMRWDVYRDNYLPSQLLFPRSGNRNHIRYACTDSQALIHR